MTTHRVPTDTATDALTRTKGRDTLHALLPFCMTTDTATPAATCTTSHAATRTKEPHNSTRITMRCSSLVSALLQLPSPPFVLPGSGDIIVQNAKNKSK